jgi:hypothetical protein
MIIGGAAVYFLDPDHGAERRSWLTGRWEERKDTVLEVARSTASTVSSVGQEVGQAVGDKVSDLRAKTEVENGKAPGEAPEAVFRKLDPAKS